MRAVRVRCGIIQYGVHLVQIVGGSVCKYLKAPILSPIRVEKIKIEPESKGGRIKLKCGDHLTIASDTSLLVVFGST